MYAHVHVQREQKIRFMVRQFFSCLYVHTFECVLFDILVGHLRERHGNDQWPPVVFGSKYVHTYVCKCTLYVRLQPSTKMASTFSLSRGVCVHTTSLLRVSVPVPVPTATTLCCRCCCWGWSADDPHAHARVAASLSCCASSTAKRR